MWNKKYRSTGHMWAPKHTTNRCMCTYMCTHMHTAGECHWRGQRELVSRPKDFRSWLCHLLVLWSRLFRMAFKVPHGLGHTKVWALSTFHHSSCVCSLLQPEQVFQVPLMFLMHPLFYTWCEHPLPDMLSTSTDLCLHLRPHTHFYLTPTQSSHGFQSLSFNFFSIFLLPRSLWSHHCA